MLNVGLKSNKEQGPHSHCLRNTNGRSQMATLLAGFHPDPIDLWGSPNPLKDNKP